MKPYQLLRGDNLALLRGMADASVDSIVTDPPYELTAGKKGGSGPANVNLDSPFGRARVGTGFMGMKWDGSGVAYKVELWREALRVLKPGGYLLAFGGTRTFHRVAVAIEDAGFELRDTIMWVYGSGMPKGTDKAKIPEPWRGAWNTALKPSWEPILVARKDMVGTLGDNLLAHGTGALNIDGCRVPVDDARYARNCSGDCGHAGTRGADDEGSTNLHTGGGSASDAGRWPANLIHDGSDKVLAAFPQASGAMAPVRGTEPSGKTDNTFGEFGGRAPSDQRDGGGSAARFFYCAKASRADRNEGCETLPSKALNWSSGEANPGSFQSPNTDRTARNHHPTVKPTDLMRYLCRLVTPPGGLVLDLFNGSGSTGKAAVLEGFRYIGLELDEDGDGNPIGYIAISEARIAAALASAQAPKLAAKPKAKTVPPPKPGEPGHIPDLFA